MKYFFTAGAIIFALSLTGSVIASLAGGPDLAFPTLGGVGMMVFAIGLKTFFPLPPTERSAKENMSYVQVDRFLRALRKCGFPTVVNPRLERVHNDGKRNVWYIKAAMQLKGINMMALTGVQYEKLEELMPANIFEYIPEYEAERLGLNAEVLNDVLPLAVLLRQNIETATQEVFDK